MMRETKATTVDGYSVTLELFTECNEPRSECYIEKGNASGSLEAARTGYLTDVHGSDKAIALATVDRIETWADANGY